jgi:hypothetical protein
LTESDDADIQQDLLEQLEVISPLSALDPDEVDHLTKRQQAFLLSFINTGSVPAAKKAAGVKQAVWAKWLDEQTFARIFKVCKSPVALMYNLSQVIVVRAALEHLKLIEHQNISTRQWAIDRAYNIVPALKLFSEGAGGDDPTKVLTYSEIKQLAAGVANELETRERRRTPFGFVEGEFKAAPPDDIPPPDQEIVIGSSDN